MSPGGAGVVRELGRLLVRRRERLALAESCTGGLVAARLTAAEGASDWLWGGVVVYTPDAKARLAGLEPGWLESHGTVGADTTRALARAVRERSGAAWGLAVTGWAGPGGGGDEDPVGTVYVALEGPASRQVRQQLEGDREGVRSAAVDLALEFLLEALDEAAEHEGPGNGGDSPRAASAPADARSGAGEAPGGGS